MIAGDHESSNSNGSIGGNQATQKMNIMDQAASSENAAPDNADANGAKDYGDGASSASSTSTQWPSAPPSPSSSTHSSSVNHNHLQTLLDRALPSHNDNDDNDPFSTHPDQAAHFKANTNMYCRQAAHKIYDADVLLVVTGAGFSADSGLATYVDVADIEAYRNRGWSYRGLCTPPCFGDFGRLAISDTASCASDGDGIGNGKGKGTNQHQRAAIDISNTRQEGENDTLVSNNQKETTATVNDDVIESNYNTMEIDNNDNEEVMAESKSKENDCDISSSGADEHEKSNLAHHRELYYSEHLDHSIDENSVHSLPDEDDIEHPQYFYGFWGQCSNDYRRVKPHDGYDIVARWGRHKNSAPKGLSGGSIHSTNEGKERNNPSSVAQEIRDITHFLEQGGDDSSDSDDSSASFMKFKQDNEDEPYYVSPTKRAGAFFVFTSNVDAHSFDVFESHEIRECHGNVEIWQCNNFSCGTNDTAAGVPVDGGSLDGGLDAESDTGCNEQHDGKPLEGKKWRRRLWRLPMDFQFSVDKTTMKAPYSKLQQTQRLEGRSALSDHGATENNKNERSGSPPAYKRRKSSMNDDDNRGGDSETCTSDNMAESGSREASNDPVDMATGLGGLMEETLRSHLERGVSESHREEQNPIDNSQHAHIGDVRGKPRLFPLRHMNPPPTSPADNELCTTTNAKKEDYYLPIAAHENWPRCPRCNEAARPAVLMFNDLDWVYNLKQEQRWQNWCQSLLKVCKRRRSSHTKVGGYDDESASTVSDTNMSDKGWNDVSQENSAKMSQKPGVIEPGRDVLMQDADETAKVKGTPNKEAENPGVAAEASGEVRKTEDKETIPTNSSDNSVTSSQSSGKKQPTSNRLKVAILEVGCGYNVPTCRVITERLVGELLLLGGDPTLIRINPSHPEPDDQSVEDSVISVMEKGLMALKKIDEYYCELSGESVVDAE